MLVNMPCMEHEHVPVFGGACFARLLVTKVHKVFKQAISTIIIIVI